MPRAREHVAAGLLLLALLVLFFRDALLSGRVLGASDLLFATPFFAEAGPAGLVRPANELLFDPVYQFVPWRHLVCDALRAGRLPLWNPGSAAGTPIVATMQAAVFYPPNVVLCFAPFAASFAWGAVLRPWIAGFATYLLLRRYGLALLPALVGGVAFMLSGFLVVWLEHPHVNVAVWLPVLVLLDEALLRAATGRARRLAASLLGLGMGVQFLGGHVETFVDVLACLAACHLIRSRQLGTGLRLAPAALATVLGVAIAAVQLLPFLEWLPLSAELARRGVEARSLVDFGFWRHLVTLPLAVFPNLYGNPTWGMPYPSFLPWGNYNETVLYVGVVPLLLALVAIGARPRPPIVRAWTWIGAVALAMAFRLPGVDWLNRLPGLHLAHPDRLRLVASFAACLLAGFGVAAIRNDGGARRRLRRLATTVAAAGAIILVAGHVVLPRCRGLIVGSARRAAATKYASLKYRARPFAHYEEQADAMASALVRAFRIDNVSMYAPAVWALGAGLLARSPLGLLALTAADLVTFGQGYHPTVPRDRFYPPTPITRRLAREPGLYRVTALGETLFPDVQLMYGLADVRGLDFRTAWYDAYLDLVPGRRPWIPYGVLLDAADSPLLRVLNVRYVVTEPGGEPDGASVVARDRGVVLAELPDVQPRGFVVHEAVVAADDGEARAFLGAAPDAVFTRAVLVGGPELAMAPAEATGDTEVIAYAPEHASWRVRTGAPAYLVVTDAWYPGWTATVDGAPAAIHRANGAFRAVRVPAGEHVVEFRYAPASVRLGGAVTAGGLLVALLLIVATARSRAPAVAP